MTNKTEKQAACESAPILNLTPHALNVHLPDGSVRVLYPDGDAPRVATETCEARTQHGVPLSAIERQIAGCEAVLAAWPPYWPKIRIVIPPGY